MHWVWPVGALILLAMATGGLALLGGHPTVATAPTSSQHRQAPGQDNGPGPSLDAAATAEPRPADPPAPAIANPVHRPGVVGILEGIPNVYHAAFREPNWTAHPSTFIPGYPREAKALNVTLNTSRAYDQAIWDSVEPAVLYYVPGTVFVGLVVSEFDEMAGFDDHSTKVAYAALLGARQVGQPVALVMAAQYFQWVEENKWIDFASLSWGFPVTPPGAPDVSPVPFPATIDSPLNPFINVSLEGRGVFHAAGNMIGTSPAVTYFDVHAPPPVFSVGAMEADSLPQQPAIEVWDTRGYDVAADSDGEYPLATGRDGYEFAAGTSVSAPRMAGVAAALVTEVRLAWSDAEGWRGGALAKARPGQALPATGPLADGRLDGQELMEVLRQAAFPWMPVATLNDAQARYFYHGYGYFNQDSVGLVRHALAGGSLEPRPWDDYWHAVVKEVAWRYWRPWPCREFVALPDWGECPTGLEEPRVLVDKALAVPQP